MVTVGSWSAGRAEPLHRPAFESGHRSVSVCHLGNISCKLGRALEWNPAAEQFVGDAEADVCKATISDTAFLNVPFLEDGKTVYKPRRKTVAV